MTRDEPEAETENRHEGLAKDKQSQNFDNRQDIEMASLYSVNANVLVRISQKVFLTRCRIKLLHLPALCLPLSPPQNLSLRFLRYKQ